MSIPYTVHDRAICDNVIFHLVGDPDDPGLIAGEEPFNAKIEFQFPPYIPSDNRKGNWDEQELRGVEPVANFITSSAREITLKWTYIVESAHHTSNNINLVRANTGTWTIFRIKQNLNRLRGYFAQIKNFNSDRKALVVLFKYSAITGIEPWTCRIKSVDVKYSQNLIGPASDCFPLRTDVTVDLRVWTQQFSETSGEKINDIPSLKPDPTFKDFWY